MVYSSVSQTVFTAGPLLLVSKNISMDPHILPRANKGCPNDRYSKLKMYISKLILDSYVYIPVAYANNALHYLALISLTVPRFAIA